MKQHKIGFAGLTFTAILPHSQVDLRNIITVSVSMGQVGNCEHVPLDPGDVVSIVTHNSS